MHPLERWLRHGQQLLSQHCLLLRIRTRSSSSGKIKDKVRQCQRFDNVISVSNSLAGSSKPTTQLISNQC